MKPQTPRQQLIYDYLKQKKTPQGAYDILDACRVHGFKAPSQIYRVLNKLREFGLIHKGESLNAYIACEQQHDSGQSVVAICNSCGLVKEVPIPDFSNQFEKFDGWEGFTPQELAVEVKGRCSLCNRDLAT